MARASPLALALVLTLLSVGVAGAHDLGVARVRLDETGENAYVLSLLTTPAMRAFFPTPVLPERADLDVTTAVDSRAGRLSWSFTTGQRPLTAGDVIHLPWKREGAMLTAHWRDGTTATFFFKRGDTGTDLDLAFLKAGSGSLVDTAKRYTALGVEHILSGIDHLLFVLGLLLLVEGGWRLVKTITAFTVAHSITLGLATLGLVQVPLRAVEAVIALSIVFLSIEILHRQRGQMTAAGRAPWAVAFGFGLVHGLGFASALNALGLPGREIPAALLFFNVGVEVGQLLFVLAFLVLRELFWRLRVVVPSWLQSIPAYGIGIVATYWFVGRAALVFG